MDKHQLGCVESASRPQDAGYLRHDVTAARVEIKQAVHQHDTKAVVGKCRRPRLAMDKLYAVTGLSGTLQHRFTKVEASDHRAAEACELRVHARPAPQVKHPLPGLELGEDRHGCDSAEALHDFRRQGIQEFGRIADTLSQSASRWKGSVCRSRVFGDPGVGIPHHSFEVRVSLSVHPFQDRPNNGIIQILNRLSGVSGKAYTMDFNLYPLWVFRTIARCQQATRAAEELGISQPAVSAHLQSLERRFGERLFERTPKGLRLTEKGAAVLEHTHLLFARLEELDALRGEPLHGTVQLAASSTPGAYLLPGRLKAFSQTHRELFPLLSVGDSGYVLKAVESLEVPLGIVGELPAERHPSLHRQPWATDRLRLMAGADNPLVQVKELEPARLRDQCLILREPGSSTRAYAEGMLLDYLGQFGRVLELASPEAVKEAVVAGLGVAVLSSWATHRRVCCFLSRFQVWSASGSSIWFGALPRRWGQRPARSGIFWKRPKQTRIGPRQEID